MVKIIGCFSASGGAGTSVMTANIAVYSAQKGKKVLLIDAAPNGGTLHAYMDIPYNELSTEVHEHFSVQPLIATSYHNLKFFSNMRYTDSKDFNDYFIKWEGELRKSEFDYVFIDLGSSIDEYSLKALTWVDLCMLFTAPDSVSFEKNSYLLKSIFNYRLSSLSLKNNLAYTVDDIKRNQKPFLFALRNLLSLVSEERTDMKKFITSVVKDINIGIVFNKIRYSSSEDHMDYYPMVVRNYFGFDITPMGAIPYSESIASSSYSCEPFVVNEKNSDFTDSFSTLLSRMISVLSNEKRVVSQLFNPLTYYEIMGLDKGCSTHDIQVAYELVKGIYNLKSPTIRGLFNEESLYIYNSLLSEIYLNLVDPEKRKEYDMEESSKKLKSSLPENFSMKDTLKKYARQKKPNKIFEKRDIFGREADQQAEDISIDKSGINDIFAKYETDVFCGEYLAEIRESLGISTKQMSDLTKISVFVIKSIEDDYYTKLPAEIYVKGFLASYCKALGFEKWMVDKVVEDYLGLMKGKKRRKIEPEKE